ncbi:MAG: RNA-dependent RNA polymerase [Fushun phasmavirus 2]|uniref:RNA-directed RNA polymerase L n=1 Tax=Fushun phasmavirus 2 TaxID=2905465 RepID=A0A8K1XFF1_9VIRU|nr:MAG: RNA-dependent RNA polymerase [Fushun phasmavirus 2]UHM27634.1 MAG: RNA-dependent RNA polymerase [Fushun phasmavirus 2]
MNPKEEEEKTKRILAYRGRVDRLLAEHQRLKDSQYENIALRPYGHVDLVYRSLIDQLIERARSGIPYETAEACQDYSVLVETRHQVWVDFFERAIIKRRNKFTGKILNVNIMEVKVENFCRSLNIAFCPPDIANLCPDILYVSNRANTIIISDVAVTKQDVARLNSFKMGKYSGVIKYLKRMTSYDVQWIPAIIKEDGSNANEVMNQWLKFVELERNYVAFNQAIDMTNGVNNAINLLLQNCKNPHDVYMVIHEVQSSKDPIKIDMPHCRPTVEREQAQVDELTIGKWVKEVTDKEMRDGYFDKSYDDTENAFIKLEESYRFETDTNGHILKNTNGDPIRKKTMAPKSTLKVIAQTEDIEEKSGHALIRDYIEDIHTITKHDNLDIGTYVTQLLPTTNQLKMMSEFKKVPLDNSTQKANRVFGEYQYEMLPNKGNVLFSDTMVKLSKGKKNSNVKWTPQSTNPDDWLDHFNFINDSMYNLGSPSNKKPFLDSEWDASTHFENQCTDYEREQYDYVRHTNGAQLCQAVSNLYQRLMHMNTSQGMKDNIYIPPNGAFIAIIPKEHAPISSKDCNLPFIFLTRTRSGRMCRYEYEYSFRTKHYTYYVSKLCRMAISKLESWDQAGYRLVACASYLLGRCRPLIACREMLIGTLTYFMIDNHQKTSEYLDLLKYVSFMPFSDIHRLSKLIQDKFSVIMKTQLNSWTLMKMMQFMKELSDIGKINATKPKIVISNGLMTRSSFGMSMTLPSFINNDIRHRSAESYIEEVTMLNIVRPKHLYGSQFMDKSLTDTAKWNNEYKAECNKYGNWLVDGRGLVGEPYPFDSKFAFCRDAILIALDHARTNLPISANQLVKSLSKSSYTSFMHYNCSLRGCTKEVKDRTTPNDYHTTSLESCINFYKAKGYDDKKCTASAVATDFLNSGDPMSFSMSEKDQRGGGRPISTPTLGTKALLMMVEKPEQEIGKLTKNNILVEKKNKLKEQSEAYKNLVTEATLSKFTKIYQLTEDQTKFSENDNTRKFIPYINNNHILDKQTRQYQILGINKLIGREHLVHRQPVEIAKDPQLAEYKLKVHNGCKAIIGWPQGMLNNISTSIHSIADTWITHLYNRMYPNNKVKAKGLVHSDDSWVTVACNDLADFKRYAIFRKVAKKLFCLKLNEKKLWGSKYMGELVSNYNINGNVHLPVSKTVANSLTNILFQNWVIDSHNQVSSLQQAYRNGANLATIILMKTILRQQLLDSYVVKGMHKRLISLLPIELGGFPSESAFELAVNGVNCHYMHLAEHYMAHPDSDETKICTRAVMMSIEKNISKKEEVSSKYKKVVTTKVDEKDKKKPRFDDSINEDDYEMTGVAHKGDIFTAIRHLLPKTKKMSKTVEAIKSLPFEETKLEMVVTRPNLLKDALGNLKSQTKTMLYDLAADHYTQNTRRLAISQAIQSSGRVLKLGEYKPCTFNEMYDTLLKLNKYDGEWHETLRIAFDDDTVIPNICNSIINHSDYNPIITDHRKIINVMPSVEDNYKTQCTMQHVLLRIIDDDRRRRGIDSSLLLTHSTGVEDEALLTSDAKAIRDRFKCYFEVYEVEYACNLIMRQYMMRTKSRIFMQPYLKNDSEVTFLCDLYGKTICSTQDYRVVIDYTIKGPKTKPDVKIESLYTVAVLNTVYRGLFPARKIQGVSIQQILKDIDIAKLSNDELLKLAILRKIHLSDESLFEYYSKNKEYVERYDKAQKWNGRLKRWVGGYDVTCAMGGCVLRIIRDDTGVSIMSNEVNVTNILMVLHAFVNQSFRYVSYSNPQLWHQCPELEGSLKDSTLYLSCYTGQMSTITHSRCGKSIPFDLDKSLVKPDVIRVVGTQEIHLKENLRVVYTKVNDKERRIGSARQGLRCPLANQISITPGMLDGLMTQSLLTNNLISSITRGSYDNNEIGDYKNALFKSNMGMSVGPVVGFIGSVIEIITKVDIGYDFARLAEEIEKPQVIVVEDMTPANMAILHDAPTHLSTEPEDCTHLLEEFIGPEVVYQKKLTPAKNIRRICAKVIYNTISDNMVTEILNKVMKVPRIRKEIMVMINENPSFADPNVKHTDLEVLDDMEEIVQKCEQEDVYGIILAFGLDNPETLIKYITRDQLIKPVITNNYRESSQYAYKFENELYRVLKFDHVDMTIDPLNDIVNIANMRV